MTNAQARRLALTLGRLIDLLIDAYTAHIRRYPHAADPPDPAEWGFDAEIPF